VEPENAKLCCPDDIFTLGSRNEWLSADVGILIDGLVEPLR